MQTDFSSESGPRQAETELHWKTIFLEALADSTIEGILVVDRHGRKLLNNQKFTDIFGIPSDWAFDGRQTMLEHIASWMKVPEAFLTRTRELFERPDEASREEIELKDGTVLDRYTAPVIAKDGQYHGRIWTFRDVTARKRNEDALRQLSVLVEQSPVSVVITDLGGTITYVNPKFTEITGYAAAEVLGKSPRILRSGLTPRDVYHALWSTIGQGGEWRGEFCNKKKNGELFWEAAKVRPIKDSTGTTTHYLAVKEDITDRRRAEEELRTSRQMLQTILDAIPQRVFWKDTDCNYLGCNRPFAADAGLDGPEDIIGKSDFDLSWSGVAELYRDDDRLVMERGSPKLNFQEHQTRPDGSLLWLQTNKLPLLNPEGTVVGVVGTYEDVTERRRAETELRLTKCSLEIASDAVFWLDPQGRIVYGNAAVCRSLGHSREELASLSVPDIDPLLPPEKWRAFWEEGKRRGSMTFETQHRDKQGRVFPVEVTANYLEFDGQEYSFAFARDISERRELEGQLRQAQKLEGIGQLAAGIAHEINTPAQFVADNLTFLGSSWTAIAKLLDLYRRSVRDMDGKLPSNLDQEVRELERSCDLDFILAEVPRAIEQSLEGANRVAKIVRAMKEFSHPDPAEKVSTDLNRAVESTLTVARNELKYVADVVTEFDADLPLVLCYPGDINQVVLNLLVNAAHAIHERNQDKERGQISVRTHTRDGSVEISVADNGTGIPEAIRTKVFDPFFTTKEVGKGTGQGLSLAHTLIVKKHSGRIWFDTKTGQGTTFFIELPITPGEKPKEQ